jgi:hypothetical protein
MVKQVFAYRMKLGYAKLVTNAVYFSQMCPLLFLVVVKQEAAVLGLHVWTILILLYIRLLYIYIGGPCRQATFYTTSATIMTINFF